MLTELLPSDPPTVGPYTLLGRLGTGGMGVVFLARSPGGRQVAVKVIRPEYAGEPGFRIRFAREVAAARNVSGMFTALVVDADTQGAMPWLATAYVPAPSLAEAVETAGPLPPESVLQLAAGLAEGLQAIHEAGLVHRDLKPSNVLLAADGPRVIDFGISKAREESVLTETGMVVGSPGFLSPEQAEGSEIGPPSDIFSLGGVLAYAATGAGPFGSGPTPALLYRVVNRDPDLSRVPDAVRPVIERCLAKDPAVRPTPAELLAELGAGAAAGVGAVMPQWLPESITSTIARYVPTAQTAAAQAPAPLAEGVGGGDLIPAPGRRHRRRLLLAAAATIVGIGGVATGLGLSGGGPGKPISGPARTPVVDATRGSASATARPSARRTPTHPAASRSAKHTKHPVTHAASPATSAAAPSTEPGLAPTPGLSTGPAPATATTPPATHKPAPTPTSAAAQAIASAPGATQSSCSDLGAIGSIPGGSPVTFGFSNDSPANVTVYYLESNGSAEGADTISPGHSYYPSAATDQSWLVHNASGGCLGIVTIDEAGQVSVS